LEKEKKLRTKCEGSLKTFLFLNKIVGKEAVYENTTHINTSTGCIWSTTKYDIQIMYFDNQRVYYRHLTGGEDSMTIDYFIGCIKNGTIQIKGKD
jgi:hypothetical protein